MLICILTKNVITSCSVTMMLFLHLDVKPLMTLTTVLYFFFNDTATTEIYTLSLHDALPICPAPTTPFPAPASSPLPPFACPPYPDRKSTRLNSSHLVISYAVFCLKKNIY